MLYIKKLKRDPKLFKINVWVKVYHASAHKISPVCQYLSQNKFLNFEISSWMQQRDIFAMTEATMHQNI